MSELEVRLVPRKWANKIQVSVRDQLKIALLRVAGCGCQFPIIRDAVRWDENDNSSYSIGPRCKICDKQVWIENVTDEEELEYLRQQHRNNIETMKQMPQLRESEHFKDLDKCFPGCGCDG